MKNRWERKMGQLLLENSEQIDKILSAVKIGIWEVVEEEGKPAAMYADHTMRILLGVENTELSPEECYEWWFQRIEPSYLCAFPQTMAEITEEGNTEFQYMWNHPVCGRIYVRCGGIKIREEGNRYTICGYHQDITDRRNIEQEKEKLSIQNEEILKRIETLYNNIPGAVFSCRFNEGWDVIEANDGLFEFLGYTREEFAAMGNQMASVIYPMDLEVMTERIQEQLKNGSTTVENENRLVCKNGELKWIEIKAQLLTDEQNEQYFYCVFVDITHQKKIEEELIAEKEKNDIAIENSSLMVWEYNVEQHIVICNQKSIENFSIEETVTNAPWSILETGFVCEESRQDYLALYEEVLKGTETTPRDIQIRKKDGKTVWCRMALKPIRKVQGKVVRAIGWGTDVTSEKEMHQHFQEELRNLEKAKGGNLIAKGQANLTKDSMVHYSGDERYRISHSGMSYSASTEILAQGAHTKEQQEQIRHMLERTRVMKEFKKGNTGYTLVYQRESNQGEFIWVNTMAKTYQDPVSGDLMSFMYTYDINEQKIMQTIIDKIAQIEYEYMGVIDLTNEYFYALHYRQEGPQTLDAENLKYEEEIGIFTEEYVIPEEKKTAATAMSLETICEHLESAEVYACSFSIVNGTRRRRKKWEYIYADEDRTSIIFVRSDITEEFIQQERQKETLKNALAQAEVASRAKSDFLSRMSHEIRTPMNAIIGMSALAAQNVNNPNQVAECISNVGLSARFLLSLINDILDMSRIESGKMTLKEEKFSLEELLNGLNSIIYEQATDKGIDYDCIMTSFTNSHYVGDAMKIQQVLINLLGNAVKFTPTGGRVQLQIHQNTSADGKVHMVFTVNDTGVGMSEEFQKKMFNPFEQENSSTVSPYGGTGLGLAISKNLISMMGGMISVNSIKGIGSEFTVNLTLGQCEETYERRLATGEVSFEKLHTLIVDDDVLICEHTKRVLSDMGMRAEWVDSGRKAVDLVRERWNKNKFFDVILLDWKMPDMDGIETARELRKIVGPEVTIIIMTAYDWISIEPEAKAAGVNLLIAKPLFKSSIMSAFEKIYCKQNEEKQENKEIEYDFSGKRVLLVEDHILNVEVAKRLLESRNIQVDVAENGLASIEALTTAPEGYYDMILMDIRMPVMDGLTAARALRHLKKEYAATVPIVAMSANAFDEDVEKSKAAGMNAHLAKPIEPDQLFAALYGFWEK